MKKVFKIKEGNDDSNERYMEIRLKLEQNLYEQIVGMDPGRRLVYGAVFENIFLDNNSVIAAGKNHFKLSVKQYQHMTGEVTRRNKLKKWTGAYEERQSLSRLESGREISNKNRFNEEYTNFFLQNFAEGQRIYGQRKMARLRLEKYIRVAKTLVTLAKSIVKDKTTLILIGYTHRN